LFLHFIQEEYQRLEIHASDMEAEIASLQETLITCSVEKEEALSKVELMMSEQEDLENRFTSTESKMNSLSDEIVVLVYLQWLCKYFWPDLHVPLLLSNLEISVLHDTEQKARCI
jgi:predicted RNA-binding protein Jag